MNTNRGSRHYFSILFATILHELLEPMLKVMEEVATLLFLFTVFIVQSLTMLISFNTLVASSYRLIQARVTHLISTALALFYHFNHSSPSPISMNHNYSLQQKAVATCIAKMFIHYAWLMIAYEIHKSIAWKDFLQWDTAVMIIIQILIEFIKFHVEMELSEDNLRTLSKMKISLIVLTPVLAGFITKKMYYVPALQTIAMIYILRDAIDLLVSSSSLIHRIFENMINSSGSDNSSHQSDHYFMDIIQSIFWIYIGLFQLSIQPKHQRVFLWTILIHELFSIYTPLKLYIIKAIHDQIVEINFKKLHPAELQTMQGEVCPICLNAHTVDSVYLSCRHVIHASCLTRILQQGPRHARCPLCRVPIAIHAFGESRSNRSHPSSRRIPPAPNTIAAPIHSQNSSSLLTSHHHNSRTRINPHSNLTSRLEAPIETQRPRSEPSSRPDRNSNRMGGRRRVEDPLVALAAIDIFGASMEVDAEDNDHMDDDVFDILETTDQVLNHTNVLLYNESTTVEPTPNVAETVNPTSSSTDAVVMIIGNDVINEEPSIISNEGSSSDPVILPCSDNLSGRKRRSINSTDPISDESIPTESNRNDNSSVESAKKPKITESG